MSGEVKPQDKDSGLVERSWVRTSKRAGVARETTLEGEQVKAAWIDRTGSVRHAVGLVKRNGVGTIIGRQLHARILVATKSFS